MIWVKNIVMSLAIALVFFIILNGAISFYLITIQKSEENNEGSEYFYSSIENDKILKARFDADSGVVHDQVSMPIPHTAVDYISKDAPSYKVGIEGIRYLDSWNDQYVKKSLSAPSVFVFGGSTAFGSVVGNDHTIPAYLNQIDANNTYLNFGTSGYDSIREINRLIYLLKKGYRPKSVIFIDGLNDISNFGRSPYNIHDTPNIWGVFRKRPSDIQIISGYFQESNTARAYLYALPLVQLVKRTQFYQNNLGETYQRYSGEFEGKDMQIKELLEYYRHWPSIRINWRENLSKDIIDYYKKGIQFIHKLSKGFGFSVYFVYQPIGLLDVNNPFIKPGFENSNLFKIYKYIDLQLKREIENTSLAMNDCSRSLFHAGDQDYWVDPTHYSPKGNKVLAKCILKIMRGETG
jgi:lysophospholipase L1-like esterase